VVCSIGIYAHRYGYVPKGEDKSITQIEYELAIQLGKDCLCFIVDSDFDWKPRFVEFTKAEAHRAILNKVKEKHALSFFADPRDFETKLTAGHSRLL